MKVLSVRQPWAWAIIAGHKTIENRRWSTTYRGPLLIHAGQKMRIQDYRRLLDYGDEDGFQVPEREDLHLGGIIGKAVLVDIVTKAKGNPWFEGPYGWCLVEPRKLPFRPLLGKLRLFEEAE
ncbi:MAG: ASCH domain-containing protein [Hyphomicrobium sp.]|nr:ASCH domain-containing protein [Hyphomicrobium sp.]